MSWWACVSDRAFHSTAICSRSGFSSFLSPEWSESLCKVAIWLLRRMFLRIYALEFSMHLDYQFGHGYLRQISVNLANISSLLQKCSLESNACKKNCPALTLVPGLRRGSTILVDARSLWSMRSTFVRWCLMHVFRASIHISSSGLQNLKAVGYYHEESFKFCPSNWDGRYPDEKDSSLINLWYACSLWIALTIDKSCEQIWTENDSWTHVVIINCDQLGNKINPLHHHR